MTDIEKLLDEEIVDELTSLKEDIELGEEVYDDTVNGLSKLFDKSIELKKLKIDKELKLLQLNTDAEIKLSQIESEKKNNKTKNIITLIEISAPLVIGSIWSYKTLKFEEEGTVNSLIGKNILSGISKFKFWK